MRAFVLTAPGEGAVEEVAAPRAGPGEVVVDVERVGVCGTDVEFFTGEMAYLTQGHARFPMRLGHEWAGTVAAVGDGVDPGWVGRRVMGDTMLGDGVCRRCRRGHQHVCEHRQEVGIRGGRDGALAEQVVVPATSLHALPGEVDPVLGALVEPGGSAFRSAQAAKLHVGDRALILAGSPSCIDTRTLALKDVTAVGILSASPGLPATIRAYAAREVDPRPLVAATVGLGQVGAVLGGRRPAGSGPGPKIHIDPRLP